MIYVTGDCHGNFQRFQSECFPEQANMTKDDTVIITGDFGGVWFGDSRDDETLDWLERLPFTLAFVCGNHENYDALARYPVAEWRGGKVHRVRPHVLHLMRGEVFDIDGLTVLAMGGAASNDRQYRREGRSWWPEEMPSEEEMEHCRASLDRVGWKVDHVVTHEAPAALAEGLCRERGREYRGDPLQTFLGELDGRLDYCAWFFGHYHGDEWLDAGHRLIYQDIVPIEDATPGSRNLLEAL